MRCLSNFIWVLSATLDFYKPSGNASAAQVQIIRAGSGLDAMWSNRLKGGSSDPPLDGLGTSPVRTS
jgi:hypothetical protein